MSETPVSAGAGGQFSLAESTRKHARYAAYVFWVMFSINFFNYFDRYILPAALGPISDDIGLSFAGAGLLASAFLLVYALCALPLGYWADRGIRKNVIAIGVGLWSIATFLTGLATSVPAMFLARSAVGVGEAGYYPAGTSLLSDYFPSAKRAQILSRWTAGSFIGLALGFIAGGVIAGLSAHSWRYAFFIAGVPGLLFTFLAYRLREPRRGHADGWTGDGTATDPMNAESDPAADAHKVPLGQAFRELLSIRTIVVTILIQIFGFWVLGAAANWLPIFLHLRFGATTGQAGIIAGAVLVFAGGLGAILGGWVADLFTRRWISGRVIVGSLGFLVGAPFMVLTLLSANFTPTPNLLVFIPFFFITGMLLNVYNGPLSAISQDVVRPELRAMSVAISLLLAHLLGDATAPFQIGLIINSLTGHALFDLLNQSAKGLEGLDPHGTNTALAMLITMPAMLALAGLVGLIGSRVVGKDLKSIEAVRQERVQVAA